MTQLYKWISCKQEPLTSYATGLLALAMELNEVATDADIRYQTRHLLFEDNQILGMCRREREG